MIASATTVSRNVLGGWRVLLRGLGPSVAFDINANCCAPMDVLPTMETIPDGRYIDNACAAIPDE